MADNFKKKLVGSTHMAFHLSFGNAPTSPAFAVPENSPDSNIVILEKTICL